MVVIVGNVALDLLLQVLYGAKVPPVDDMLSEETKPDFNGIEPGAVLGRIHEAETV